MSAKGMVIWLEESGVGSSIFELWDPALPVDEYQLTDDVQSLVERFHQRIDRGDDAGVILIEDCKQRELSALLLVATLVEHYGNTLSSLNSRLRGWKDKGHCRYIGEYFIHANLIGSGEQGRMLPAWAEQVSIQERIADIKSGVPVPANKYALSRL